MKTKNITAIGSLMSMMFLLMISISCSDHVLDEEPKAFLNPDVVLKNKSGFDSYITSIHAALRSAYFENDDYGYGTNIWDFQIGTDVGMTGDPGIATYVDYRTWLTPQSPAVNHHWEWAYLRVIPRANTVIEYAEKPDAIWKDDAEKNATIAEARFLRAYTYNVLANLFGGVPIVAEVAKGPQLDFKRSTRAEVYNFVAQDLVFASQWLPVTTTQEGRVSKAAADHLLAEVYISLGKYDDAIASASAVINDGKHQLMTTRFGKYTSKPGDVFSDLFKDNNQNSSSGNKETIWAMQFEFMTPGGIPKNGGGNGSLRAWGPRYFAIKDPDGKTAMKVADSLGRPVGWYRGTDYFNYEIWQNNPDDIRNSPYNIRRKFYYNEPSSNYFKQLVDPATAKDLDTMYFYYPYIRKIEGEALAGATYGRTFKEFYLMRLAETYLLRAEAYFRNGDSQKAADDINVVRSRANATPIGAGDVSIDFILDERARELTVEELRRLTLSRMGLLVERVKKYNYRSKNSIQSYHELFPIPQKFIDSNLELKVVQNDGYAQ